MSIIRRPIDLGERFDELAAVLELFALAGSLTYGVLADKYSRRTTFVTACGKCTPSMKRRTIDILIIGSIGSNVQLVVFCVGSALQCGAHRFSDLVIGRAIGGFGIGALR